MSDYSIIRSVIVAQFAQISINMPIVEAHACMYHTIDALSVFVNDETRFFASHRDGGLSHSKNAPYYMKDTMARNIATLSA